MFELHALSRINELTHLPILRSNVQDLLLLLMTFWPGMVYVMDRFMDLQLI